MTSIVIVDKTGTLKTLTIKEYNEDELYKKCGFKKADGFSKMNEWKIKLQGKKYNVSVYGKITGKANSENKYDFPPPIDNVLFFGACALVGKEEGSETLNLTVDLWVQLYEKLFGGFEDLSATAIEDENEIDELANMPSEKKTKQGYLKDGFVVDSSDTEEDTNHGSDIDSEELLNDSKSDSSEDLEIEDIGSELDEEEYDYEDEE